MFPTGDARPSSRHGLAADGPGARARLRVEESGSVVLLILGRCCRVAAAANGCPGFKAELIFAAIAAVARNDGGIAPGLAGRNRFESGHRYAPRKTGEGFFSFALDAGAARGLDAARGSAHLVTHSRSLEKQRRGKRRLRIGQPNSWRRAAIGGGGQSDRWDRQCKQYKDKS